VRFAGVGSFAFHVDGVPAPQGSKKAFVPRGASRPVVLDDNRGRLREWRALVQAAAVEAVGGRPPLGGPVMVAVTFWMPRGASVKRAYPSVRPDLDKLERALLDALTIAGVFGDDSQVVEIRSRKAYGTPGADVIVQQIGEVK
jgi:Holliday junction resolvase RusA-like endonuclease